MTLTKPLSFLAALPLLAGCVSVLPEQEVPSGLYRLGDIQPTASLSRSLSVREPEGGRVFGGKELAAEQSDGSLKLIKGVEWTEAATRMLQLGLIDAFDTTSGGLAVASDTGAPTELELAWRMSDFTIANGIARCRLDLTLLDGRSREPLMKRRVETISEASSNSGPARAAALRDAARACVTEAATVIASARQGS